MILAWVLDFPIVPIDKIIVFALDNEECNTHMLIMNRYKKTRLDQKSTKQPIVNKLVRNNRTVNHNGLNSSAFDPSVANSLVNAVNPRIFLGSSAAHKQFWSYK